MNQSSDESRHPLWRRPRYWWFFGIPLGGFLMLGLGAILLGTVNWVVHATSSTEFCFSCHSHEVNIRAEYESSTHFSNRSGVRSECADCHLPHDNWFELMATKIIVSADIIPELLGKVDTPEKWEAHRGEMAEKVWAEYRENDSRFCRSCHTEEAMDVGLQSKMAATLHASAAENNKTCIDCHKGIAHALPQKSAAASGQGISILTSAHAAEPEAVDCTMCHKTLPATDGHPPVGETRVEICAQCHQNTGDDPYFSGVHTKHQKVGLVCSSCHSEQGADERDAKLKIILNQ